MHSQPCDDHLALSKHTASRVCSISRDNISKKISKQNTGVQFIDLASMTSDASDVMQWTVVCRVLAYGFVVSVDVLASTV